MKNRICEVYSLCEVATTEAEKLYIIDFTEQHDEYCCRSLFSKFTKKTNLFTTQKRKNYGNN